VPLRRGELATVQRELSLRGAPLADDKPLTLAAFGASGEVFRAAHFFEDAKIGVGTGEKNP